MSKENDFSPIGKIYQSFADVYYLYCAANSEEKKNLRKVISDHTAFLNEAISEYEYMESCNGFRQGVSLNNKDC